LFVNNLGPYGSAMVVDCAGSCNNNIVRNNIMFDSSKKLIYWQSGNNIIQNNIIYSTAGTVIEYPTGRMLNCAQIIPSADVDNDGSINDNNKCVNPLFVNAVGNNFHLQSSSPAIDAGTFTGMPAGRIASIYNTLASLHGLSSYADAKTLAGSNWDAGIDEVG